MLLSLAACGSDTQEASAAPESTEETSPSPEPTPTPEPIPQEQYIETGETISTDVVEFTISDDLSSEAVYNAVQALVEVEDNLSFDEYRWSCRR